jgi:hypothetical protein
MTTQAIRPIKTVVQASKMMEGAGVRIARTVGTAGLKNLDPFLMLDELKVSCRAARSRRLDLRSTSRDTT